MFFELRVSQVWGNYWKSLCLQYPLGVLGLNLLSSSNTPGASLEYTKSFV